MYEQSLGIHSCVVKYIRAWLPSQGPRGVLASLTRTCMGTFKQSKKIAWPWGCRHYAMSITRSICP